MFILKCFNAYVPPSADLWLVEFFKLLLLFVCILDLPIILPLEGFKLLSSSPFFSDRRFVGLWWNRSANVTRYTLSCPNADCQNETLIGIVESTLFQVFTRNEVIVTLTAIYQCNRTTAQVTVPRIETPTSIQTTPTSVPTTPTSVPTTLTSVPTTPASLPTTPPTVLTGTCTVRCTYFLNIQRRGRSYLDNVWDYFDT